MFTEQLGKYIVFAYEHVAQLLFIFPKLGGCILFNISRVYLNASPDFKEGKLDAAIQAMITDGAWQSLSTHTTPYFTSGVVEDCVIYSIKTAEK